MSYIVIYTQNNGYTCGCCRQEWSSYEEFNTLEEVKNFYLNNAFKNKPGSNIDLFTHKIERISNDEFDIDEIYEVSRKITIKELNNVDVGPSGEGNS